MRYPIDNPNLSSPFGPRSLGDGFHDGVDFACSVGTDVKAVLPGTVKYINYDADGYGKYAILEHKANHSHICTLYAHLSSLKVKVDDLVAGGEKIALSGNTGHSTGPHLHFEVRLTEYGPSFWDKLQANRFLHCVNPVDYFVSDFLDVLPHDPGFDAIKRLADANIINGYPDKTFRPDQNITRLEVAYIVDRLMDQKE